MLTEKGVIWIVYLHQELPAEGWGRITNQKTRVRRLNSFDKHFNISLKLYKILLEHFSYDKIMIMIF
jgi:hypothetical protein